MIYYNNGKLLMLQPVHYCFNVKSSYNQIQDGII